MRLLTILLALLFGVFAQAQSVGTVDVEFSSARLDSLMSINQRTNYNQTRLEGYRIQIYSGSGVASKKEAEEIEAKALKLFPREKIYLRYYAPFWRVKIGDYRFRSEAMVLLAQVKRHFPGAYTVRDNEVSKKSFK
ncbi:MAG: SPOR domain-containing protein [Bacteroidales bacterium]|nr:SPOR domain-containing protein [Bacteroidales bacterium]